ncbi:SDR family oxidoreductase [bacterium SCSIO 12741]|nr:SDR family oxidoreductase [bacterium SCSIO 12741]
MRVFISGASGLVGGNCYTYFTEKGWEVVGSHFSYPTDYTVPFDTLNPDSSENFDLATWKPDYILHCGALTWVDYCEQNPEESYEKTVQSTLNLIELSERLGARLVFISTDYVFDGENGPYSEEDTLNPLSVYGKHKLEAEQKALENPNSLAIRITNVYGKELRNKNFVMRLIDNIKKGEPMELNLPADQYATPANAADIARALYLLIRDGKNGVYHIGSTDYLNRVQLAERILRYYPAPHVSIIPKTTPELNPPAARPLRGGLRSEKFLSEYPDFNYTNVDDFLRSLQDSK